MLFIIDFDGTVAPVDTVDALLERFAAPAWRQIEEQWVSDQIDSQQCMAAQIDLVSGDRSSLEHFLESVDLDPAFTDFVLYASTFADLAIVSDGLDYPIRHALQRPGIPPIAIYANKLGFRTGGLEISFPYTDAACAVNSGVCKCAVSRSLVRGRAVTTVLIGDGRSDQCFARSAGHVFAKGSLRRFCEQERIAHTPFDSFADVLAVIRRWNVLPYDKVLEESACPLAGP
jgi:2-hydroxy-3-keto-5-methylthiopentenyl-1-phosphate phosphatase